MTSGHDCRDLRGHALHRHALHPRAGMRARLDQVHRVDAERSVGSSAPARLPKATSRCRPRHTCSCRLSNVCCVSVATCSEKVTSCSWARCSTPSSGTWPATIGHLFPPYDTLAHLILPLPVARGTMQGTLASTSHESCRCAS